MTRTTVQSVLVLSVAAVAATGGFYGSRLAAGPTPGPSTQPAEEAATVPVATEPVRAGELADTAGAFGVVQARPGDAATLGVPFEAVIKAVHVTAGENVLAGAALFEIDASPEAKLQLRQAEQGMAVAQANLGHVRRRRDEQLATNADVTAAEQTLQSARTTFEAQQSRGVGATRTLKATVDGVVTTLSVQPGQIVAAGTPLAVVSPDASLEIRLGVDPADLAGVKTGDVVSVVVPDSTNTLVGTVRQQSGQLNAQRLCDVFVRPNATASLRPGTFVRATFTRRMVRGLIVPRTATQLEDEDWCVYTVKNDKAARHVVTLGVTDGKDVVVTGGGLADGDDVVVERNGELTDGAAVKTEVPDEDDK